jgi:hypothetical protein
MEEPGSFIRLVYIFQITRRYIPEDHGVDGGSIFCDALMWFSLPLGPED